ncbi:MAG TPA: GAF and ANTAR domain-containing protein [Nocardioidaceae bacterium]|nr:GAF and ANTAR domain-containing protein [Nocardioidaceae bacterium]
MSADSRSTPDETFTSLARILYTGSTYAQIYARIAAAAVDVIPGCGHACVSTLAAGQQLVCEGATDDTARLVDQLETECGEGPCMDAILDQRFQFDPDIRASSTWPKLTEQILARTPVRGMVSYRLLVGDGKAGALNIFSDSPGALTEESADIGTVLAAFASVVIAAARESHRAESLLAGLHSNREIGKAVGILMATHRIDDDEAFRILRTMSSQLNVKVAVVAARLVGEHRQEVAPRSLGESGDQGQ